MIQPEQLPFPLEPVTELNWFLIMAEYFMFFVVASAFALVAVYAKSRYGPGTGGEVKWTKDNKKASSDGLSLDRVVLAGPLEEMGFRGTAVLAAQAFSLPVVPVLYIVNGIWSGYHFRSFYTFGFTFILGLFFTKFWFYGIDGLWWVAVVMHSGHNFVAYMLSRLPTPEYEKEPSPSP